MRGHLAAILAGATLLIPAGCGSSEEEGEPLPQDAVAAISARLDEVQRRYEDGTTNDNRGACDDIEEDSYRAIDMMVEDLPADVDQDVREALEASLSRLQELTREGCSNVEEEPEPETTPTETVPETTVPEETVPEQTDTEETTPEPNPKGKDKDKQKGKDRNGNTTAPGGTTVPPGNNGGQLAPEAEDD